MKASAQGLQEERAKGEEAQQDSGTGGGGLDEGIASYKRELKSS